MSIRVLIKGIIQAAFSPKTKSEIYYLTDGKGYSWREIILTIKKIVLEDFLFFPLPENLIYFLAWLTDIFKAAGIIKSYFGRKALQVMTQTAWLFSAAKAKRDFSFNPRYTIEEGIKETVNYYSVAL